MAREIVVFGSGHTDKNTKEWELAVSLGKYLASHGFVTVTGGYNGVMEAVSIGAQLNDGKTIGILHSPPEVKSPNKYLDEYRIAEDYLDRMSILLRIPTAIALPGGTGTIAEISVAIALLFRGLNTTLALYEPYWKEPIQSCYKPLSSVKNLHGIFWFSKIEDLDRWKVLQ